jgi:NTP pyrophosphatase (non-canonical NTP hydrolase)
MTREDYLYLCAIEECGELAQALSKASRFGIDDYYDKAGMDNQACVKVEFNHLLACLEALADYGVDTLEDEQLKIEKHHKLGKWLEYSKKRGKVIDG